jgi:hypothetical protein
MRAHRYVGRLVRGAADHQAAAHFAAHWTDLPVVRR